MSDKPYLDLRPRPIFFRLVGLAELGIAVWHFATGNWELGLTFAIFAGLFAWWPRQREIIYFWGIMRGRLDVIGAGSEALGRDWDLHEFLIVECDRNDLMLKKDYPWRRKPQWQR